MKYSNKEDFEKADVFGVGQPNDGFAQYFIGDSFLKPLTKPGECPVFLANVTFEPGCRNNWHIHHAKSGGGQLLICTAGEGWYQEEGNINRWLAGNCFGDYYTRKGLDNGQREMITFCYIAAQGGCEPQLMSHTVANFANGNDKEFMLKVVSCMVPFIGYPRSLNAIAVVNQAAEKNN